MDLLTFDDALAKASDFTDTKPHILLGNGFSIACRPDRFRYDALLDEATFEEASADLGRVFNILGTTDFERVIELLGLSAELADIYETSDGDLSDRLRADAAVVRDALARVLAARHPDVPFDIAESEYTAAREFLQHFERIYSINYDMLLYWTIMQEGEPDVARNDGFGNPDDEDAPHVVWHPYVRYDSQRIFYLHGGLHLYDDGVDLVKITWSRTQVPLVDQIREALAEGRYPLIITEGTSAEKISKILHSAYLTHAIRSFSMIRKPLFAFGLSLGPNDDHLLQRIKEGRTPALFLSVFGDPDDERNLHLIERAQRLADERPADRPLELNFFDADSAHVWG